MVSGRVAAIAGIVLLVLALLVGVVLVLGHVGGGTLPTSAASAGPTATAQPTAAPATATPAQDGGGGGGSQPTPTPRPAPTGQTILSFGIPQTVKCPTPEGTIHLTWTTVNATGVTISIDGPGPFADYPANGSADVPFACSEAQHTYLITTHGTGAAATKTVVVKRAT